MKIPANIIVFTQNLKLASISGICSLIDRTKPVVFITSHCLFENEKKFLSDIFESIEVFSFSYFLSDAEMEKCDRHAYEIQNKDIVKYYAQIKKEKNISIISKILEIYEPVTKILLCDDLGIDKQCWLENGFKEVRLDYYYIHENGIKKISKLSVIKRYLDSEIYSAYYNGKRLQDGY